ncbi:MAG: Xaa-Pro peptidase family protein [Chloroflexi bacterium]|nr:Xaa-Pro peptidase family protein [Chloroflexota bacterium]
MDNDRIKQFQILLAAHADLTFLPLSADLQYLTGIPREFPNFGTILHPGAWLEGVWLTPDHSPIFTLSRMSAEFGGMGADGDIRILGDWDDPATMVQQVLDMFRLPPTPRVAVSDNTRAEALVHLQALLPQMRLVSATAILRTMRVIKTDADIATMRKAGEITEAAFAAVLKQLKHGMTELDVMVEVDYQLKQHGAAGPSFTTAMYNSGPDFPLILGHPEQKWHRKLQPPMTLLFDFGAIYEGWCYDFGRTVFFGEPPESALRVHRLVMESQKAGVAALIAGQYTAEDVDAAARKVIDDAGEGEYFRHRLGHGIGLDVHEPPFLTHGDTILLQEGMLFTVEPSIMHDNDFSARVEDVVVVRKNGGEKLTSDFQNLIIYE